MSNTRSFTDKELVEMIKDEGQRALALEHLYREARLNITKLAARYRGGRSDAEEVAAEAILTLVHQISSGKFRGDAALKTYFLGICKYKWRERLAKPRSYVDVETQADALKMEMDFAEEMDKKVRRERVKACLQQLEERCQNLLRWRFWEPEDWPWQKVAEALGLSNAQVARNQGQRCFAKFRQIFEQPQTI